MKMKQLKLFINASLVLMSIFILLNACSKGGNSPSTPTTPPVTDPCAGKTITVTGSATLVDACSGAKVSVSASGSTSFTYSIDGGSFGASSDFSNVTVGDHTISVKDGAGCTQSAKVTVTQIAAGPFFSAVKTLIQTQCVSCHSGAGASAGKDWSNDCLVSDMKIITDWVNAGGRYSD
jgi:hypothetical protein